MCAQSDEAAGRRDAAAWATSSATPAGWGVLCCAADMHVLCLWAEDSPIAAASRSCNHPAAMAVSRRPWGALAVN